jgi:hypothetical protein
MTITCQAFFTFQRFFNFSTQVGLLMLSNYCTLNFRKFFQ